MKGSLRAGLGIVLVLPQLAMAQDSRSLEAALARVAPGEELLVITADGQRLKARFDRVSPSDLQVLRQGQTTLVPAPKVVRVTVRDSNKNGALIGGAIGGAIGLVGSLALGSLCANEGSTCGGLILAIMAGGIGGGAGIGWLGDNVHQRVVYDNAPTIPRDFRSEISVRMASDARHSKRFPTLTGSWGLQLASGLGIEANVSRSYARGSGTSAGDGRGTSVDGRVLYEFGRRRVRPYVTGGLGYFEYYEHRTFVVPGFAGREEISDRTDRIHGLAMIAGGGARIRLAPKVSLRPEVVWYNQPGGGVTGIRAGVGAAFGW